MLIVKTARRCLNGGNFHLFLGIVLGLYLHANITYLGGCGDDVDAADGNLPMFERADVFRRPLAPRLVRPGDLRNTSGARKATAKVIRPRYYSTELGIREKLFVGVFTSEEKVPSQAVHINQTVTHLVDKVKFFITAQRKLKAKFNLSGVVGFTDTRYRYRPFQVVKYIGDTFSQDYDFYFLTNDFNYLNAEKLKDTVERISVKKDVYLGTTVKDGSYCDLDAGILLSNSVLRAMKEHLDWCVINAVTDDHSENIGRCVHHSTGLVCQDVLQGQSINSFKVKHFSVQEHLKDLKKHPEFDISTTVYPITDPIDFYMLHVYFSKRKLLDYNKKIKILSQNLNESWPSGIRPGAKPASRFDLPNTYYFNMTHMFFPDDFTNIRKHTTSDLQDIEQIIEKITRKVSTDKNLSYLRLVNGYRTFDMSRGLDYKIDLGFRDLQSGKEIIKRFEVCKPLGSVEFVPVPYVTENSRVAILLPVQESKVAEAMEFLLQYSSTIMEKREKALLVLILLYQYESESKGELDPYGSLKGYALKTSDKYHNEDTKIVWVSIRLPQHPLVKPVTIEKFPALNFAIIDLALRKIGLDTIILVVDVYAELTLDFLNRVKMNTISNFQIFSPIPFRQYHPNITQIPQLEINKNIGHFDGDEYKYVSFYGNDYVPARKAAKDRVPIIRSDNDIELLLKHENHQDGNVFKLFVEYSVDIHCMRATDMSFKVKYYASLFEGDVLPERSLFLGNKGQLASYIMTKDAKFREDN